MLEIHDSGADNKIDVHPSVAKAVRGSISIHGSRNLISFGQHIVTPNSMLSIVVHDDNNVIDLLGEGSAKGFMIYMQGGGCRLTVGRRTTFNAGAQFLLHETSGISIGADCMFSGNIRLQTSDMHPIFDLETRERLNPAGCIEIGDHVWVGYEALILKNTRIGSGSVVGARSVVAGEVPENCVAVGVPAKVVRWNVDWGRKLP